MPHLTAAKVRSAQHPKGKKSPVRIPGGDGLYLQISPADAKSWVLRFKISGKEQYMGLGRADADGKNGLSLAQARECTSEQRKLLRHGVNPIDERERLLGVKRLAEEHDLERYFRKAAEGCIEARRGGWKNQKHAKQWETTLNDYVYPVLGDRPVADITVSDVADVLRPIWLTKATTARRLRQRIETVLDYSAAPARRWRSSENPARWRGSLEYELPKQARNGQRHYPSLSRHQVNSFMAALEPHDGMAAIALKFAILTACRSGEVRGARWSEFDLDAAIWAIPESRMKAGHPHSIPLSTAAVDLLMAVKVKTRGWPGSLVFPSSQTGKRMSDMALSQLVRGMATDGLAVGDLPRWRDHDNRTVVPHGFRTTFKAWARAANYQDHLSEIALAHLDGNKSRAAYAREDLLDERRPMMEAWARHCTAIPTSVIQIRPGMRREAV